MLRKPTTGTQDLQQSSRSLSRCAHNAYLRHRAQLPPLRFSHMLPLRRRQPEITSER